MSKKLVILIWDMGIGGIQKRVKDIVFEMDKNHKNWEVTLMIQFDRPGFYFADIKSLNKVKILTSPYFRLGTLRKQPPISWLLKEIGMTSWVFSELYKIKPDVILTFLDQLSITATIFKLVTFWRKTKIVLNEGNLTSTYLLYQRKSPRFWRLLIKFFYPLADKIICPTYAIKRDLISGFSVPAKKIEVVPNWTLFKKANSNHKIYDLIFIGRLEKKKNPQFLLPLTQKLRKIFPNLKLAILGTGSLEPRLKKSIKRMGLEKNIKIFGHKKNVHEFLSKSKVLALPTLNEGMPNVILEAALCQVPSVSFYFPGVNEVIKNKKTGYFTMSANKFASYLVRLLKEDRIRKSMGTAAQTNSQQNFSSANQKKFISILTKLQKTN